jgi:hypothetical protein
MLLHLQADLPWEVTAAFVGSVAAVIPLAALCSESCTVKLDEVFLTLRPKPPAALQAAASAAAAEPYAAQGAGQGRSSSSPAPFPGAAAAGAASGPGDWQGESAVAEGVKLIAGGLEALLQRMRVSASRVVLRLEVPAAAAAGGEGSVPGCHVVALSLAQADYCGVGGGLEAGGASDGAVRVAKSLRFSGLTLELQPLAAQLPTTPSPSPPAQQQQQQQLPSASAPLPTCSLLSSANGNGCGGAVEVRLSWGLRPHSRPRISVSAQLDPFQLHLRPEDVLTVATVAAAAAQLPARAAPAAAGAAAAPAGAGAGAYQQPQLRQTLLLDQHLHPPGSRSLIEGLMLPDCEGVVVEALAGAAAAGSPRARGGSGEGGGITGQVSPQA